MAERDLVVRFIGDDRDLKRALTSSNQAVGQFDTRMQRLNKSVSRLPVSVGPALSGRATAAGAAAALAAVFTKVSVAAASDLTEQMAKVDEVFEGASESVKDWSTTTAQGLGISRREALAAAGTFGNLFATVDLGNQKSAELSTSLVQLAADLASFNNASPEDALIALRSGLIGEAEPLRRFGVLLSEARVQQLAMAESGKTNAKELTNQEKILARYSIILQDTEKAQGDVNRTSGSFANQSRQLKANVDDLASSFGGTLVPVLAGTLQIINEMVGGINDLISAGKLLRQFFQNDDTFDGWNRGVEEANESALGFFKTIRDGIPGMERFLDLRGRITGQGGESDNAPEVPEPQGARERRQDRSSQTRALERLAAARARQADQTQAIAKNIAADNERAAKAFSALVKGLGLKLDKASLTASLSDDIAVLREIERAIQRQIRREGQTFDLVQQLTDVRIQIARTIADQADQASQAASDAFNDALDALSLDLEIAETTKSFADDQAALREIESVILQRIAAEGKTTELLRLLFQNRQQQAEVRRQMAAQAQAQKQADQFEALGLTAEGDKRTPGADALTRRTRSLQEQIKGTVLDTSQTRSQLEAIIRVLSGAFGKAGRDVRRAILEMLNNISQALEGGGSGGVNVQTKFVKRGVGKLLEGLGLTAEQVKEIEQRFAQQGPGGTVPGQGTSAFGFALQPQSTSNFPRPEGESGRVEFHIYIDGEEVETRVTRRQQKKRGRGAASRRGVNPGVHR